MTGTFQLRVVAMVVGAMILIVGGDVAGRMLTAAGFSPFFVAWARFALAAVVLAPVCGLQRGEMQLLLRPALILRACLIAGGIACILTALKTEQLATVFGGFFVGPIVSYILSAIILRERVTIPRTVLLFVSFGGVLLVVKPGFGMTPGLAFALLAGVFHGSYLVATRWLAGGYRPRFLLFSQLIIGSLVLSPLAISSLPSVTPSLAGLIVISAMGSAIGNLLLVYANRIAQASVIAPLIYCQIIIATAFGFLFFGEWPDGTALLGLGVIIAAGAGSIWAAGRSQ
ncbi:DMT family transporter [Yoonia sp.]|uniref:DMT family transporter n=1 Tax=Yoonia sp. TaxID=2212373 RepID=UPI0023834F93|nr:DMT family transporter [Yoonia sp.]MDE0852408.1 DMT family transporter [Yoonia sp.]